MKIAIVHDWFVCYGGGERVVEQMLHVYPDADLFAVVDFFSDQERHHIFSKRPTTSFIQYLPFARSKYRNYLPLMPLAVEQFDLSAYDLVVSSSSAVAKGVITGPNQVHICFCHSPMRYAWDLQHQYLDESGLAVGFKSWVVRWLLHKIRMWDYRTANGVDYFIANSHFIGRRIKKAYRRESDVIHPPVDVDRFALVEKKQDYFVTASRMVPYKKIGLIVEAFAAMPDKRLVVIGDGPDFDKACAKGAANITFKGYLPNYEVVKLVGEAKAFVFAAEEDFGIAPVEAQACGTPVIAFGRGGALETIIADGDSQGRAATGTFFAEQTCEALRRAVIDFETRTAPIRPQDCRVNALRFSQDRFQREFKAYVESKCANFDATFS